MSNLKLINLIGNIFLALNFVAGALMLHWAVIIAFVIIHTLVRLTYLKAEAAEKAQMQTDTPNASSPTPTTIAPPLIRNVASVLTGFIVAALLYGIGYGLRYGFNTFVG